MSVLKLVEPLCVADDLQSLLLRRNTNRLTRAQRRAVSIGKSMKPIANLLIGSPLLLAVATGNEELEHLNRSERQRELINQSLERLVNPSPRSTLPAGPSFRWPREASDGAVICSNMDQLASFHDGGCEEWRFRPLDRLLRAKNKLAR